MNTERRTYIYNHSDSHSGDNNAKTILYTTTKEPLMPVRLTYKIHNEGLLVKALRKLKCIWFEGNKHFIIEYFKEAKNLNLEVYYQDVPEELYPVTLAEGRIKAGGVLHLDIKSFRRAVLIVDFLAKYIPPTIAEITDFANSNRLTVSTNKQDLERIMDLDYDQFFSEDRVRYIRRDIDLYEMGDIENIDEMNGIEDMYDTEDINDLSINDNNDQIDDDVSNEEIKCYGDSSDDEALESLEQRLDKFASSIREQELKDYPEVEGVKINYNKKRHKYLIDCLTIRVLMKEAVAIEHHKGNANYSSIDAIKELINNYCDSLELEDGD